MYEARVVSNLLLDLRENGDIALTNLRLNKILYFVHGWSLRREPEGLIRNHFEAWPLGPVIESVYKEFFYFGDKEIRKPAQYLDYATGLERDIPFSKISYEHRNLINDISRFYCRTSTSELVRLSHDPYGPWAVAWSKRPKGSNNGGNIAAAQIKAYFVDISHGQHNH